MSMILMVDTRDQATVNLSHYLSIVGTLLLIFSPVLAYSFLREQLRFRFSGKIFWGIWAFIFVLWPLLLFWTKAIFIFFDPNWKAWFVPVAATFLLLAELGILYSQFNTPKWAEFGWLKRLSLEKIILLALIPVAVVFVFSLNTVQVEMDSASGLAAFVIFIFSAAQIYVFLLVYYFFYLTNHYLLINKLFKEKGLIYYAFGFAATLVIFYPIAAFIVHNLPLLQEINSQSFNAFDPANANIPLFIMLLSIPFILSYQWLKQNNEIASLEKEKSETELSLLKQQINPHFFFNTLNNLYALSLTKDERTPEVILQLSELMRYVIYKGSQSEVNLDEEAKYIEDYIDLQQIRLHKKLDFKFEKEIENPQIKIPPLLFIILIENAFKHGIEPSEGDCFLHIKLESTEERLSFVCENSVEEHAVKASGIGLENLRKRLEHRYPSQHKLEIKKTKNKFIVLLLLNIFYKE